MRSPPWVVVREVKRHPVQTAICEACSSIGRASLCHSEGSGIETRQPRLRFRELRVLKSRRQIGLSRLPLKQKIASSNLVGTPRLGGRSEVFLDWQF